MEKDVLEIAESLEGTDKERFLDAFAFAKKAHDGQLRKSGKPYLSHPIAVAKRLWEKYADVDLTIAGILHDTSEDSDTIEIGDVYERFGDTIGFLVDAVDKRRKTFHKTDEVFPDKIERLLFAGSKDIRVLLLKLADRGHNIETLRYLKNDKQVRMAFETQAVYRPLTYIIDRCKTNAIADIDRCYLAYLAEKGISTPRDIKAHLYTMSFKDFNHDMFDLAYNNSNKIVWEIEDREYLQELAHNKEFEDHVRIENIWTDGERFKASFTFDKGYLLNPTIGLKVSSYKQE